MRAREIRHSDAAGKAELAQMLAARVLDDPTQYSSKSIQTIYAATVCGQYDKITLDAPVGADLVRNAHHRDEMLRRLDYAMNVDPKAELERIRESPRAFFDDWVWMLDPREIRRDELAMQPFRLFGFQVELVEFIRELFEARESGIVKKSRDMGLSVIGVGFGTWLWLCWDNAIVGYGSYKEDYVTKKESRHALLPKVPIILDNLPTWMRPDGWSELRHYKEKLIVNPQNDAQIIGETGDQLGRAGRASWFLADEFAYVRNQEASVAALAGTSDSTIYASTSAGPGTYFAQMERAGGIPTRVYRWVWDPRKLDDPKQVGSDDPASAWRDKKVRQVGPVIFAREFDCNDIGALDRVIIQPDWIMSARRIELTAEPVLYAGLDLGEAVDKSSLVIRSGGVVIHIEAWEHTPMREVCDKALRACAHHGVEFLAYDVDGIGAEFGGHHAKHELADVVKIVPVRNQGKPTGRRHEDAPDVPAKNRFTNRITELWWALRLRFWKTHDRYANGADWPDDECISLPNNHPYIETLARQLASMQYEDAPAGKIRRAEKRESSTESPDEADSLVYCEMPHPINVKQSQTPRSPNLQASKRNSAW